MINGFALPLASQLGTLLARSITPNYLRAALQHRSKLYFSAVNMMEPVSG